MIGRFCEKRGKGKLDLGNWLQTGLGKAQSGLLWEESWGEHLKMCYGLG